MTEQRFTLAEASAFGRLTGRIAKLERERKSIDDQLTRCCQLRDALLGHPRDGHRLGAAAYSQATIDWWLSRFRPAPPVLPEEAQPMRFKVTFIRHGGTDELVFDTRSDAQTFADWLYPASAGVDPEISEVLAEEQTGGIA